MVLQFMMGCGGQDLLILLRAQEVSRIGQDLLYSCALKK